MTEVIDASRRFRLNHNRGETPLGTMRQTKRVDLADRVLLAERLGAIAADLCPERPKRAAKRWFDLWDGDRWDKRKRLICFPGETIRNPSDEGAFVAGGADWAALIERAAKDLAPEGPSATKDRERIARDILRGTKFLPVLNVTPLRAENAQSLMAALCEAISGRIENDTDLRRLWEVLDTTPFDIESYESEPREDTDQHSMDFYKYFKYEGDTYSNGPFGKASKLAAEPSTFRYRTAEDGGYRFGFSKSLGSMDWQYPIIKLGMLGHARRTRMFVIPQEFVRDLPQEREEELEEGDVTPEQCAFEWMVLKGFRSDERNGSFSEIAFDPVKGYGWRNFDYEIGQFVWLEIRPKPDGLPSLWVTISENELDIYLPRLSGLDVLATVANTRNTMDSFYAFWTSETDGTSGVAYSFLTWPKDNSAFTPTGKFPLGAASGWLDGDSEYRPATYGWLDDFDNEELQEALFRNGSGVRFCSSIAVEMGISPPCQVGTVAAAIFLNAGCSNERLSGWQLVHQALTLATNGLAFHDVVMDHHRAVIANMFDS